MGFKWSHHTSGGWTSQLDRVRRWHSNLQGIRKARSENNTMDYECDAVYIFFQNAYHLRDWIKEDVPSVSKSLESFFRQNKEMQLCRDICNGLKHFRLSNASVDSHFAIGREYVPTDVLSERPHINETWFIIADGEKRDIFELADRCMNLWEQFVATFLVSPDKRINSQ